MTAHITMRIDFLYWEECPSHDEALARLKEVLAEEQIGATVRLIHVATDAEAQELRFPGSPTIRLNGQDLFDAPAGMIAGLTCRVYYADDGQVTPLPSKEMIRRALRKRLGKSVAGLIPFALRGTDERIHTTEDYAGAKILGVIFTCNHCPYARAWEDRLIQAQRDYATRGVQFLLISSNDPAKYPDDSFKQMQRRAREKRYPFPYLFDETQEVARAYGATRTPEIFIFDQHRVLRYHGAPDDNYEDPNAVRQPYLRDALEALLSGRQPEIDATKPVGCTIKWKSS